ncbi:GAF domain-containing sensor histidine kinase [Candidatus Entotheonella palauensis]|uniref:GAF domain-containing sensor histidine kinase n=1 Tax=Candidatus Entotheonella palauensis TaxID=93172 RepID=UPI000B7E3216|nr:GAF domain-containing sensor histidine kinase [Candidatus Entotheonella palauensis]
MVEAGKPNTPSGAELACATGVGPGQPLPDTLPSAIPLGAHDEVRRLEALRVTQLLDSASESSFDRLTALACQLLGAPVSLISLVDAQRQFFKSSQGLAEPWASRRETPLSHSFCQHVVAQDAPLVISDARQHALVCDNPAIQDLGVSAYLGVPLRTPDGDVIGSLCVIDRESRTWTEQDLTMLHQLAEPTMMEIAARWHLEQRQQVEHELRQTQATLEQRVIERTTELSQSERRYRDLVEGSIQGLLIHRDGQAVFVNQAFAEMHGYDSPTDIYGLTSLPDLVAPHDRERLIRYRDERIAGHAVPAQYEFQGVKRDGTWIWLAAVARMIRWDGAPAVQLTVMDQTASKQAEETLQRDDRLAMLGRLAATFSHEVRNPLQALRLYAEILEEEVAEHFPDLQSAPRKIMDDALMVIREEATRMSDIVQDYLSLARLGTITREPVDLGVLIAGIVREQREALTRHGLSLQLDGIEDLGEALLHPSTFRRAIFNLLQNAMEAMAGGGCLTLRGRQASEQLQLDIVDTGPGIPPEALSEIFTPFHTTKAEGTGLGLYVVQEIIAAHDGRIGVESELGQGTAFSISLPRITLTSGG